MLDRTMLYNIIYALAARDGREKALFGACAPKALEAFTHSVPTNAFPELWFELPLMGEPWFDLHALTAREDLDPTMPFDANTTGGCPEAFLWLAAQKDGVRQLALSWDVSSGKAAQPAVQLLVHRDALEVTCGFLDAVGRHDATFAYRAFTERLPEGWFACYTGVFPGRPGHNLRVECIPERTLQRAYARDVSLMEDHLRQVGLEDVGDTLIERCATMAATPFMFEFQFDVNPQGLADSTVGASLRFAEPASAGPWQPFDPNGPAGELMEKIESWGLADERWRLLADTAFAQRVTLGGQSAVLWSFPAFIKLRWRDGNPLDAKAYLMAGVQ